MRGFYWVNWTNGNETMHSEAQVWAMLNDIELAHQIEHVEAV